MAHVFRQVVPGCDDYYDDDNDMLEPEDGLDDDLNIDYRRASDVVVGFVGLCASCTLGPCVLDYALCQGSYMLPMLFTSWALHFYLKQVWGSLGTLYIYYILLRKHI